MSTMAPIYPGTHLAEMLEEREITQYRLARTVGVPSRRINEIVHGRRAITADTSLRLGRALGMTPDFRLNPQRLSDLEVARASTDVSAIQPLGRGRR
jgi:addiction module HigA family antidote